MTHHWYHTKQHAGMVQCDLDVTQPHLLLSLDVGSSIKMTEGLAHSSTLTVSLLCCYKRLTAPTMTQPYKTACRLNTK